MRILVLAALPALIAAAPAGPDVSDAAAKGVIENYYAAIERGDFHGAYASWKNSGRASGKSFASFSAGFARTAHTRVVAGTPVDGDAGMSQRWIQVPVDVYATLKNGGRQHFRERYMLHRVVAGVGAPVSKQRWHIVSANLRQI